MANCKKILSHLVIAQLALVRHLKKLHSGYISMKRCGLLFVHRLNKVRQRTSDSFKDGFHQSCWIREAAGTLDETVKYLRFQTDTNGKLLSNKQLQTSFSVTLLFSIHKQHGCLD